MQAWFKKARDLDPSYCDELEELIKRRSFCVETEPFVPKWLEVSPISHSVGTALLIQILCLIGCLHDHHNDHIDTVRAA